MFVQVGVRAGIYHGAEALCDITSTRPESGSNPFWNQYLDFDLNLVDIPRMARLCLVIYGIYVTTKKTRRRAKEVEIIAQHANQFGHNIIFTLDLSPTTARLNIIIIIRYIFQGLVLPEEHNNFRSDMLCCLHLFVTFCWTSVVWAKS